MINIFLSSFSSIDFFTDDGSSICSSQPESLISPLSSRGACMRAESQTQSSVYENIYRDEKTTTRGVAVFMSANKSFLIVHANCHCPCFYIKITFAVI